MRFDSSARTFLNTRRKNNKYKMKVFFGNRSLFTVQEINKTVLYLKGVLTLTLVYLIKSFWQLLLIWFTVSIANVLLLHWQSQ